MALDRINLFRNLAAATCALVATTVLGRTPWPGQDYAEVRGYAYNREGQPDREIVKGGRIDNTVIKRSGTQLTSEQVQRLLGAVSGKHPSPELFAMCFNPRHAFIFFDTNRKPVAWVEVCFQCDNASTEPSQHKQYYDMSALAKLREELKLPELIDHRNDEKERKQIEASRARWLAAMPTPIRPLWKTTWQEVIPDIRPFRAALAREFPDKRVRILALLEWYGSGEGPWSGYASYEDVAEKLLLDLPTVDIITVVQTTTLSAKQTEGAARFFAGSDLSRQRPNDLKALPLDLKRNLLKHSLQSKDRDKRARARRAFD